MAQKSAPSAAGKMSNETFEQNSGGNGRFAETNLKLARKLLFSGKHGFEVSDDGEELYIDNVDENGVRKRKTIKFSDPNQREKIIFILRHGFYYHSMHIGSRLSFEMPVTGSTGTRYCDVAILRDRPVGTKGLPHVIGLVENKITGAGRPAKKCMDEALAQLSDQIRILGEQGRTAPTVAATVIVMDGDCVSDPEWKSGDYFNSINGEEKMPTTRGSLDKACESAIEKHGMFVVTWFVDAEEADKAILDGRTPVSFTMAHCDRLPLSGTCGCPSSRKAFDIRLGTDVIGRLPFFNPTPGGVLQNMRELKTEAVLPVARGRFEEAVAASRSGSNMGWSAFQATQTGANSRRVCAVNGQTRITMTQENADGSHWMDIVSCNISLGDGQSSSAAIAVLAEGAKSTRNGLDGFMDAARRAGGRLGIDMTGVEEMRKVFTEGLAAGTKAEKEKLSLVGEFLLAGEMPVVIELADNQQQGADNTRKANLSTSQSQIDVVGAKRRHQSREVVRNFDEMAKANRFSQYKLTDVKSARIEPEEFIPVSDLAAIEYIGLAMEAPRQKATEKIKEKFGQNLSVAEFTPKGPLRIEENDGGDFAGLYIAMQMLNRSMFEAGTHAMAVDSTYAKCMPATRYANDRLDDILTEIFTAARECDGHAVIDVCKAAGAKSKVNIKKSRSDKTPRHVKEIVSRKIDELVNFAETLRQTVASRDISANGIANVLAGHVNQTKDELAKTEKSDVVIRMTYLIGECRTAAGGFNDVSSMPVDVIARVILASVLFTFGGVDAVLGTNETMRLKKWLESAKLKIQKCANILHAKFAVIRDANSNHDVKRLVSTDWMKALSKGSLDVVRPDSGTGNGAVGAAMPKCLMFGKGFQGWPSTVIWLMSGNIDALGAVISNNMDIPALVVWRA